MQGEAVKANIRFAMKKGVDTADDSGENAPHSTNLEDMLNVIDGAGAVNVEGEFARTLMTLNEEKEIAALDAGITALKLQRAAEATLAETAGADDDCLQQVTELGTLKLLVTPFVSIVKCERARRLLVAGPPSRTKEETAYSEAMREMVTNTKSFEASNVSTTVTAKVNFSIWKSSSCVQLQKSIKSSFEELRGEATQIQGMLLDLDHLCKPANVVECIETLRTWANKADLMKLLKSFQGAAGRGVKHFEAMTATLGCAGIFTPGPEMEGLDGVHFPPTAGAQGQAAKKTYKELQQDFVKIRQSARLQLSLRSAAIIIHDKDVASVAAFEKDIKPLKVAMPKAIKDKLAELKK
jgi:hypothetical protein